MLARLHARNPLAQMDICCADADNDGAHATGFRQMAIKRNQKNKRIVWEFWQALEKAEASQIEGLARLVMAEETAWFGPDPIKRLQGPEALVSGFWLPLRESFPDLRRQSHLFFGGQSNGRIDGDISRDGESWVGGTGYLIGTFTQGGIEIGGTSTPPDLARGARRRVRC